MTCRHCDEPTTGYWGDVCLRCAGAWEKASAPAEYPMFHRMRHVSPDHVVSETKWGDDEGVKDFIPSSDPDPYEGSWLWH